jgi:hypothetical protein
MDKKLSSVSAPISAPSLSPHYAGISASLWNASSVKHKMAKCDKWWMGMKIQTVCSTTVDDSILGCNDILLVQFLIPGITVHVQH